MAITIGGKSIGRAMELDEYVEWVHQNVSGQDAASVQESAPQLRALGENRHLITDVICRSLKSEESYFQAANQYTDSALLLYVSGRDHRVRRRKLDFAVRACVWRVPRVWNDNTQRDNNVHSYGLMHDHNFTFMTVGYFGPGYRTRVFEYDYSKVTGFIGERVDITPLEDTTLPVGKVMFYRKNRDIHIQYPPQAMSISLNLLITMDRLEVPLMTQQYEFDLDKGCISRYAIGPSDNGVSLLQLAAELGDENTADVVYAVAHSDPRPRVRAEAFAACARMLPFDREHLQAEIFRDPSPVVRRTRVLEP